jgi:hypothetical protein
MRYADKETLKAQCGNEIGAGRNEADNAHDGVSGTDYSLPLTILSPTI